MSHAAGTECLTCYVNQAHASKSRLALFSHDKPPHLWMAWFERESIVLACEPVTAWDLW